jgi:hypothetical protein
MHIISMVNSKKKSLVGLNFVWVNGWFGTNEFSWVKLIKGGPQFDPHNYNRKGVRIT